MATDLEERIKELRAKTAHACELAAVVEPLQAATYLKSYAADLEAHATKLESELGQRPAQDCT